MPSTGSCYPPSLHKSNEKPLLLRDPLRDAKFGSTTLSRLHDDLHIMAQGDEEPHQAFYRIAAELACQHCRYLGLIDANELSGGRLRQMPLPDGPVDLNDQAGLDQVFAGVGQAEVCEDVARAGLPSARSKLTQVCLAELTHEFVHKTGGGTGRLARWPEAKVRA